MEINGIAQTNGATATQQLATQTVTQDDFLKLLIAQLQNQDPLEPMDNQEFAAQLATFNSLGQLIEINDKLGGLNNNQGVVNQLNAASLIGKEVVASGNAVHLTGGGTAKIGYTLASDARKVTLKIFNSSGVLVRQTELGSQSAGGRSVSWDGKNQAGQPLAGGEYRFEVAALDAGGRAVPVTSQTRGVVTGVNLSGAEPILELGAIQVPLSGISGVAAPEK